MTNKIEVHHHIGQRTVERALDGMIEQARAHLDLEGIAYIKVVRTGKDECFATDATADVFRKDGMTNADMERDYWRHPKSLHPYPR